MPTYKRGAMNVVTVHKGQDTTGSGWDTNDLFELDPRGGGTDYAHEAGHWMGLENSGASWNLMYSAETGYGPPRHGWGARVRGFWDLDTILNDKGNRHCCE